MFSLTISKYWVQKRKYVRHGSSLKDFIIQWDEDGCLIHTWSYSIVSSASPSRPGKGIISKKKWPLDGSVTSQSPNRKSLNYFICDYNLWEEITGFPFTFAKILRLQNPTGYLQDQSLSIKFTLIIWMQEDVKSNSLENYTNFGSIYVALNFSYL